MVTKKLPDSSMSCWGFSMKGEVVLICAACGYQWNETCEFAESGIAKTFALFCPACESNMVHHYDPNKEQEMGENYDGMPWY